MTFLRSQEESKADWEGLLENLYRAGLEGRSLRLIPAMDLRACSGDSYGLSASPHRRCWVRNILEKTQKRDYDEVKTGAQAIIWPRARPRP